MDIGEISGFNPLLYIDINIRVYYFTPDMDIV